MLPSRYQDCCIAGLYACVRVLVLQSLDVQPCSKAFFDNYSYVQLVATSSPYSPACTCVWACGHASRELSKHLDSSPESRRLAGGHQTVLRVRPQSWTRVSLMGND